MSDDVECPHCGHVDDINEFLDDSDVAQANGALQCPECEACILQDD